MARTIAADVKRATDICLDYLKGNGIEISRPSVVYTGGYCEVNKDYGGMARGEIEELQKTMGDFTKRSAIPEMRKYFKEMGITLSDAGLEDSLDVMNSRINEMIGADRIVEYNRNLPGDIALFKTLPDSAEKSGLPRDEAIARTLMHEMWHYVQRLRNKMSTPVCEGEAEAAESFFERDVGYRSRLEGVSVEKDKLKTAVGDLAYDLLYRNGLRIVRRHSRSVKTIHNPEVRKKTESDFKDFFRERLRKDMKKKKLTQEQSDLTLTIFPELEELKEGVTAERLLSVYEKMGYAQFLKEIRDADLNLLVEHIRKKYETT